MIPNRINSILQQVGHYHARPTIPTSSIHAVLSRTKTSSSKVPQKSHLTLEVERKFVPTIQSIASLRENNGSPPFNHIACLGKKTLHDTYFDIKSPHCLSKDKPCGLMDRGIYLRQRNGEWEVKIQTSGDYTRSGCLEIKGARDVENYIHENTEVREFGSSLIRAANIFTRREEWTVDLSFNVVVDQSVFLPTHNNDRAKYDTIDTQRPIHIVGEVEICQAVDEHVHAHDQTKMSEEMDAQIQKFMQRYRWAFPVDQEPLGKLSAWEKYRGAEGKGEEE